MINVVIPLGGKDLYFTDHEFPYPKPLIEINGLMLVEHVVNNFKNLKNVRFVFVLPLAEFLKHHFDSIFNIVTNSNCEVIKLNGETKGAACTVMMATDYINNDDPLIIANADQVFDFDLNEVIGYFQRLDTDASVVTFESVHPRWSYVKVDDENNVMETSEKRPISKHAIAGLYYFSRGRDFIKAASNMIKKDASVNGLYYIAPSLNELVLGDKQISIYKIDNSSYHSFYTHQKIKEYEALKQS